MAKLSSMMLKAATAIIALSLIAATGSGQDEKKAREAKTKKADQERTTDEMKPAGKSISSVDISLRKKPSGNVVQQTTTDEKGKFSFGVLPVGSYSIVIERFPLDNMKSMNLNSSKSNICVVTLEGGASGPITREWAAAGETSAATARQTQQPSFGEKALEIRFESDGRTEVRGTLKTKHDTVKNSINNVR